MTPGACPGCGREPGRRRLICDVCWSEIPAQARKAIDDAWKVYARNPASRKFALAFETAVAAAAAHIESVGR